MIRSKQCEHFICVTSQIVKEVEQAVEQQQQKEIAFPHMSVMLLAI